MPRTGDAAGEPAYRTFLSIDESDSPPGAAYARDLIEKAFQKSEFHVIGSAKALDQLRVSDPDLGDRVRFVELPADRPGAFDLILRDNSDRDFVFVKSGVILPEYWDARLAWTAQRFPGVATVTPVFEDELRLQDDALDPALLDRLCYRHSLFSLVETGGFRADCVYVRSEAVRAASAQQFAANTKRLRYSHVVADHICAKSVAPVAGGRLNELDPALGLSKESIRASIRSDDLASQHVSDSMRPRLLHVTHNWGAGVDRWVREYCRADGEHDNLVLRAEGSWGANGTQLALYRHVDDPHPVEIWPLSAAIKSTALEHTGYKAALAKVADKYGIEAIVVSSLIGHSLDVLGTGVPTVMVCHDFYPFCPALNITFGDVCQTCTPQQLTACTVANPHHRFFPNTPPQQWLDLRGAFVRRVGDGNVTLIAPSESVRENYSRLVPELAPQIRVIPHGSRPIASEPLNLDPASNEARSRKLRLLILGSLALNKGSAIIQSIRKDLDRVADIFLVGCADAAGEVVSGTGATVIPEYEWTALPRLLREIAPDLALLPSVVPETFSYTLQELFELAIPTLATDIGSFHDRIQDGVNGFLSSPEAGHIMARVAELAEDREALARVHRHLCSTEVRRMPEMLADYREVLNLPAVSSKAYFCTDSRLGPEFAPAVTLEHVARELSLAKSRIAALETSLSWRASRPLRTLGAMYLQWKQKPPSG